MKKFFIISLFVGMLLVILPQRSFAQTGWSMMGGDTGQSTPSQSDLQEEQAMQNAGQKIYQNLQEKKITCQQLTNNDYEKLGEYFMRQAAGSTQNHVYWDQHMQSMMGDSNDTQMHVLWGERGSGCITANQNGYQTGTEGGVSPMMGWSGYGWGGLMNGGLSWGFGIIFFLFWVVVFIDLILLGIFLWRQIRLVKRK